MKEINSLEMMTEIVIDATKETAKAFEIENDKALEIVLKTSCAGPAVIEAAKKILNISLVPPEIKNSTFGCRNCLWNSIECKKGSMLKIENSKCIAYTYYD